MATTISGIRARIEEEARADADASVARETDAHVRETAYTLDALWQMGWRRSYGAARGYREAFAARFVEAWSARQAALEVR